MSDTSTDDDWVGDPDAINTGKLFLELSMPRGFRGERRLSLEIELASGGRTGCDRATPNAARFWAKNQRNKGPFNHYLYVRSGLSRRVPICNGSVSLEKPAAALPVGEKSVSYVVCT